MSDSCSRGEFPAAPGGVSDMEDLEQRMADRMDTALTQRMDVMSAAIDQRVDALVDKLSSVLQGASGGNRSESGGGGSAAASGGNQFAPGVQSETPGGAEMSSIPGRPPTAVGPVGPQEGSLEVGGVDSPGGAKQERRRKWRRWNKRPVLPLQLKGALRRGLHHQARGLPAEVRKLRRVWSQEGQVHIAAAEAAGGGAGDFG